jgi:uncharacterized protein with von Willebrand factor type A (vWA) domain
MAGASLVAQPSKEALEYAALESTLANIRQAISVCDGNNWLAKRAVKVLEKHEQETLERLGDLWFLMSDFEQHEASTRAAKASGVEIIGSENRKVPK